MRLFLRILCGIVTLIPLCSCDEEYTTRSTVCGVILESVDNLPITGAVVTNMTTGKNSITGADGYYEFQNLEFGKTYKIYVEKTGYIPSTQTITPSELRDKIELNIKLTKLP